MCVCVCAAQRNNLAQQNFSRWQQCLWQRRKCRPHFPSYKNHAMWFVHTDMDHLGVVFHFKCIRSGLKISHLQHTIGIILHKLYKRYKNFTITSTALRVMALFEVLRVHNKIWRQTTAMAVSLLSSFIYIFISSLLINFHLLMGHEQDSLSRSSSEPSPVDLHLSLIIIPTLTQVPVRIQLLLLLLGRKRAASSQT